MIRFDHVNKWYGAYLALVDVTEHIAQGEVVVVMRALSKRHDALFACTPLSLNGLAGWAPRAALGADQSA